MTDSSLPPTRYVRTSDGVSIAYMVMPGKSPAFVQVISPGGLPFSIGARRGRARESTLRFARGRAFVWFDWRATGESEGEPATSWDQLLLDLAAVIGSLREQPDLVAMNAGCLATCIFVAQHPEACRSLSLRDPMVRHPHSPQGTFVRGGYHDYSSYIYTLARSFFPASAKDEFDMIVREWPRQVPETVFLAYRALVDSVDLSTTLPSIRMPLLVYQTLPSLAARQVASLVPGSVLVDRDYGYFGERARRDWDEHIGSRFEHAGSPVSPNGLLTMREQTVLALIAEGRTNAQIALALTIAESTVARHVHNLLGKLGAANRAEAVALVAGRDMHGSV